MPGILPDLLFTDKVNNSRNFQALHGNMQKAGNSETEKCTKLYLLTMELNKSVFFFRYNCWISANQNFTCLHKYAARKALSVI